MGEGQNECGCGCGSENNGGACGSGGGSDNGLAMLCHLLAIFIGFVGPLLIWLLKKDSSAAVAYHGKESLNFQISCMIYMFGSFILCFAFIGYLLLPVLWIFWLVMTINGTIKANKGIEYRYPLCLRLIK